MKQTDEHSRLHEVLEDLLALAKADQRDDRAPYTRKDAKD